LGHPCRARQSFNFNFHFNFNCVSPRVDECTTAGCGRPFEFNFKPVSPRASRGDTQLQLQLNEKPQHHIAFISRNSNNLSIQSEQSI